MIFYKDEDSSEVYAYSEQDVDNGYVKDGLRTMTAKEVAEHLNPAAAWWTDGAQMVMASYPIEGWHKAAQEEIDQLLPSIQLKDAQGKVAQRRAAADATIAPLQDAVDLGEATEEEVAMLIAWKRYRVALIRLPDQPGYPAAIDWPAPPA